MYKRQKIDKAFLGVVGVDMNHGKISTYYVEDGLMKQAVMKQSQMNYIVCEERKRREDGQFIYGNLEDLDGMIVAGSLNKDDQKYIKEYDIDII